MDLANQRIVVTGASGALGRRVVAMALTCGAKVAALHHSSAIDLQNSHGLRHIGGVDLGNQASASAAFAEVNHHWGGIDGLVNIAGGFAWEDFVGGDVDTWDRMYHLNLRTAVVACDAAMGYLAAGKNPAIVNISANSALHAEKGVAAYTAAKAGVAKLTESLADELKGKVRVNAVLPTIIDTESNRRDMPDANFGNWVSPEELGNVILFLLSPLASAVTGALIPVQGRV